MQISISNAIGSRYRSASTPPVDPDAQAFITAASITDPTQQSAINTLVTDLKGYNIWTKMKAIYPMVGGTSTSTSYNLVNTALYQISWSGGVTWGANGVQFNGVNGFGDTNLNAASILTQDSTHLSFYSRTDVIANSVEMGINSTARQLYLLYRYGSSAFKALNRTQAAAGSLYTPTNGFLIANRPNSTTEKYYHKGSLIDTITTSSTGTISANIYIGGYNNTAVPTSREYSSKQCAFASIGSGLTDTEAANFYTAVQTFQTALGRSIGTQTVSDADAQAFVTNAGIVDQVEANAVNNLVIGLKADGLWTKMSAIYPMVGGSSSTMKYNLKNPLDTDAAFRLVFNGGWTFSSNGALPNGTNGFADTKVNAFNNLSLNSTHFSVYSRTNSSGDKRDIGAHANTEGSALILNLGGLTYYKVNSTIGNYLTVTNSNSQGNFMSNRTASNVITGWKNGVKVATGSNASTSLLNAPIYLGALWENSTASYFSDRQYAFASIGDGLTDAEALNLNTRVTTFQTALNRNV